MSIYKNHVPYNVLIQLKACLLKGLWRDIQIIFCSFKNQIPLNTSWDEGGWKNECHELNMPQLV